MEKSPKYRTCGFSTANEGEEPQWFSLEVQLHTSQFRIRDTDEEGDVPGRLSLVDCFDWAVSPCVADFEHLSPPPPPLEIGKLTLSYFVPTASFECDLVASDEILAHGKIEPLDLDEDRWPPGSLEELEDRRLQSMPWTTSFPSFTPADIVVICDDPQHPFDSNPTRVRIGDQYLYFKASPYPDDMAAKKEVETYEKIASANLGAGVRTSRLYGVVRNERSQLIGLLLHLIEEHEDSPLTFAVGPETPGASMDRWAKQIHDTLTALHRASIIWGDAKPDNILIDVHGDAWLIDFGGGRTEGWVDSDKAGTANGDVQGLVRILQFIASGGDGCSSRLLE
ncbi:hypothetical protein B0H66DRAFT_580200 [Apodospora peruviana]|uniref:Protein kinase domain-containing protein n=1 Tax=Apodospora peruviana TaxID=516989 RepID=A0AAE0IUR2_9PEZI|nr:hypothetical protein B0H66DRAFT_580200 [Apodospora peruviana]